MPNYSERVEDVLRELAAEFLVREASPQSLITVTRAVVSTDTKRAVVYITVLPREKEAPALAFANRSIFELKKFIASRARMHHLPFIEFAIDEGEKNRQRLDELSQM